MKEIAPTVRSGVEYKLLPIHITASDYIPSDVQIGFRRRRPNTHLISR
jgi:hypothetical protein